MDDPKERFLPTRELMDLVLAHTVKGQSESFDASPPQSVDYRQLIGERLEGLMANLAHGAALANEDVVRLSDGVRFDSRMCEELTFYLSLDPCNPRPVFDLVYKELLWFTSIVERERTWGNIDCDDGVIILNIYEKRTPLFSGLGQIDPEHWIVLGQDNRRSTGTNE